MDNLARCAMLAKKAGVSYGNWMAMHGEKDIKKKEEPIPDGWKPCEYCGKLFRARGTKRYCEPECRNSDYYKKNSAMFIQRVKDCQKRYREREKKNENRC